MLGLVEGADTEEQGFWNDGQLDADDSGPMRILVCGNCGVGKSTLINQVFGVNHATNVSVIIATKWKWPLLTMISRFLMIPPGDTMCGKKLHGRIALTLYYMIQRGSRLVATGNSNSWRIS